MLLVILLRFSKSFEFGAKMLNTTRTFMLSIRDLSYRNLVFLKFRLELD